LVFVRWLASVFVCTMYTHFKWASDRRRT
jgi:hypothetical protein